MLLHPNVLLNGARQRHQELLEEVARERAVARSRKPSRQRRTSASETTADFGRHPTPARA